MSPNTDIGARALEIRRIAIALIYAAGSGHPGGCLSAADALATLYFRSLRLNPGDPHWDDRDRFVLSKGHSCPALYAALQMRGYFPPSELKSFRQLNGLLQGSPHENIPGIDATCGSLGQGFSIAAGMAMGLRMKQRGARVFVMLGDGELQEGEVWEAAMFAAHHKLTNLCVIVDYNKMQSDDTNVHIMGLEPLRAKWEAFGWAVRDIDGHSPTELAAAFDEAGRGAKPLVVIANTVKGKGVSFMAGVPAWHGSVKMNETEFTRAMADLDVAADALPRYAFNG